MEAVFLQNIISITTSELRREHLVPIEHGGSIPAEHYLQVSQQASSEENILVEHGGGILS